LVCAESSGLSDGLAQKGTETYDDALKVEPKVANWILLAQNAALGAHALICEDGPVLHKEPVLHAEDGGEILE
jgi:hypothetical protein